jgi:DNA repair photolyase
VSLKPEDVEVIVFWTRNPKPLFPYLPELDQRGYRYYVQYTLMNNPVELDPKVPPPESALVTFRELANKVTPKNVIWRYDPIVFSSKTDAKFHQHTYQHLAKELRGYTHRSVISIVDMYRKTKRRLNALAKQGVSITMYNGPSEREFEELMRTLARTAHENDMDIVSCAEEIALQSYGIRPGKCIDDEYIKDIFDIDVTHKKDKSQRKDCGCVVSRDIGMYDTCIYGCQYCYATSSFERAKKNREQHNPASPSLIGWHDVKIPNQRRF